jgi:VanZ family protein
VPGYIPGMSRTLFLMTVRLTSWLLLLAITALTVVPPTLRPLSGLGQNVEHFTIFLLMGAAFALAYRRYLYPVGLALLLFTGALELVQMLVPGRHARLSDFVFDGLGVCIGMVAGACLSRLVPSG